VSGFQIIYDFAKSSLSSEGNGFIVSGETAAGVSNAFRFQCDNDPNILKVMLDRNRNISRGFIPMEVADVMGIEREAP
jgi:hypothetical protein